MKKIEIIGYILLILCAYVIGGISWTFVCGALIVIRLFYKIYGKSLPQEMKEEKIKEADQKDRKQLLFKPNTRVIIFFIFMILLGISVIAQVLLQLNEDSFGYIIVSFFVIGISLLMWYITPVFIFAEDSIQIKSFLLYVFDIDRKTMIKYADITSVEPDARMKSIFYGSFYGRYRIGISVRGTTKIWPAPFYNSDIIAKIYLRFKEKLGDKVILE
jgi:hypothetical protein